MKKRAVRGLVAVGMLLVSLGLKVLAEVGSQCLGSPLTRGMEMIDSPSARLSLGRGVAVVGRGISAVRMRVAAFSRVVAGAPAGQPLPGVKAAAEPKCAVSGVA